MTFSNARGASPQMPRETEKTRAVVQAFRRVVPTLLERLGQTSVPIRLLSIAKDRGIHTIEFQSLPVDGLLRRVGAGFLMVVNCPPGREEKYQGLLRDDALL